MPEQPNPDPVAAAFDALIVTVGKYAVENARAIGVPEFERTMSFHRRLVDMATRWDAGGTAHKPRGSKAEG